MPNLNLNKVLEILKRFNKRANILILGSLAMQHYGKRSRTINFDAEVAGVSPEVLQRYLAQNGIPSDLGEDVSRWSVISIPRGYRRRAVCIFRNEKIVVNVMAPLDLIISKLRRFSEEDIEDSIYLVNKFSISKNEILKHARRAIKESPKDTTVFAFRKNVGLFIEMIGKTI